MVEIPTSQQTAVVSPSEMNLLLRQNLAVLEWVKTGQMPSISQEEVARAAQAKHCTTKQTVRVATLTSMLTRVDSRTTIPTWTTERLMLNHCAVTRLVLARSRDLSTPMLVRVWAHGKIILLRAKSASALLKNETVFKCYRQPSDTKLRGSQSQGSAHWVASLT